MKLDLNCKVEYFKSFLKIPEANDLYNELLTYNELTSQFAMVLANGERFQESYGKMMFIDRNLFEEKRFPKSIWGHSQVWSDKMNIVRDRIECNTGHRFVLATSVQ